MDSDIFRIFYGLTMKTLYVTPCDAHTKQFESHVMKLLWTCLVYITKCVPDTKNKKKTIQAALNEVFSLRVTACDANRQQFESYHESVQDMVCIHHKVSPRHSMRRTTNKQS